MPTRRFSRIAILLLFFSLTIARNSAAQSEPRLPPSHELVAAIAAADSVMFHAFNTGDLDQLRTMFTQDLEFYHDQTGLTSYEENMEAFANLFARDHGLRRDLVPGSLEVYPVKEHSAIEVGEHTFCHEEGGATDCGTFPFVMVWRKVDGAWKVSRVISYGH